MFEIAIQEFSGPLDLLLQLIEARKLEVSKIALREITGEYLVYMQRTPLHPEEIADYLLVLTKLLLLKASAMNLEAPQDEEDEEDLEAQLRLFEKVKQLRRALEKALRHRQQMWERDISLEELRIFQPIPLDVTALAALVKGVLVSAVAPVQSIPLKKLMRLEEAIAQLITLLDSKGEFELASTLRALVKNVASDPRDALIAFFLASLTLFREGRVHIEQEEVFGRIVVKRAQ